MPPEFYPIAEIQPEWILQHEGMGSKSKFWHSNPEDGESNWLFKYPRRPSSGEHWAEKIVAEVAGLLDVPHARVELAEYQGIRGSITENIVPVHHDLIHGNEVLESSIIFQDSPDVNFHSSDHTLENIWLAMSTTFGSDAVVIEAKSRFAEYLVLDAVVGNTDRHSENWGILKRHNTFRSIESLAPSYDHGSSLGHELSEDRRQQFVTEGRLAYYVDMGRGEIYWLRTDRHGPSPLKLARLAARKYPREFQSGMGKLCNLRDSDLHTIVERIPEYWMTSYEREFAIDLMRYCSRQLREAT